MRGSSRLPRPSAVRSTRVRVRGERRDVDGGTEEEVRLRDEERGGGGRAPLPRERTVGDAHGDLDFLDQIVRYRVTS